MRGKKPLVYALLVIAALIASMPNSVAGLHLCPPRSLQGSSIAPVLATSPSAVLTEARSNWQDVADGTPAQADEANRFQFPLSSYSSPNLNSGFDFGVWRPIEGRYHLGEDVLSDPETSVYATGNGVVSYTGDWDDFGGVILIDHQLPDSSHVCSIVGHLSPTSLRATGSLYRGEPVGEIGTSDENGGYDPHLHFGIRRGPCPDPPGRPWGLSPDEAELDSWWGSYGLCSDTQ